jgi:AraC family L-rhamnose operon transcriptional activator RhaR
MRAEPSHPWSIDELCALLHGIDSSYLSRLFRSGVGLPPLGWLIRHRANLAAVQLVQSETPISEIGGAVGWPDPNHFARRFRGVFGESPREYRSRRRISESD